MALDDACRSGPSPDEAVDRDRVEYPTGAEAGFGEEPVQDGGEGPRSHDSIGTPKPRLRWLATSGAADRPRPGGAVARPGSGPTARRTWGRATARIAAAL